MTKQELITAIENKTGLVYSSESSSKLIPEISVAHFRAPIINDGPLSKRERPNLLSVSLCEKHLGRKGWHVSGISWYQDFNLYELQYQAPKLNAAEYDAWLDRANNREDY